MFELYIIGKYTCNMADTFSTREEAEKIGKHYVERGQQLGRTWKYVIVEVDR